jgi:hypothetical protein
MREDGLRTIDSDEDIALSNRKWDSGLLQKIKSSLTSMLILAMWILSLVFLAYIIWYLYLTATVTVSPIATNMQDIIIKVSGWLLFVLSQVGILNRKK